MNALIPQEQLIGFEIGAKAETDLYKPGQRNAEIKTKSIRTNVYGISRRIKAW